MCHVSYVRCQLSGVRCNFFYIYFFFLQNGGACRGRVCYQRGLPRLVFYDNDNDNDNDDDDDDDDDDNNNGYGFFSSS